jgi:hypothetical protein
VTALRLADLGLPIYISAPACPDRNAPGGTPFDLLLQDFRNSGRIFGATDRAERLIAEQRKVIDAASGLRQRRPDIIVLGHHTGQRAEPNNTAVDKLAAMRAARRFRSYPPSSSAGSSR